MILTKDDEAALRWFYENDPACEDDDPNRKEKFAAWEAVGRLLACQDELRVRASNVKDMAPLTSVGVSDTTQVASMLMQGQLAPSPFMTIGFAQALAQTSELLDLAWGVIANAGGGNWDLETPEWRQAAERFRDRYHTPTMHDAPPEPSVKEFVRGALTELRVVSLRDRIEPHLSDQARRDLRPEAHHGWLDDMVTVARTYDEPPTDAMLQVLAMDLSGAVETLRTSERYPMRADGLLSTFMGFPLAGGRYVVVCYARVIGSDVPEARAWLTETLLRTCRVRVVRQGEIPPAGR